MDKVAVNKNGQMFFKSSVLFMLPIFSLPDGQKRQIHRILIIY